MSRTLADMTPEERQICVGMRGDTPTITAVIASIVATTKGSMVRLYRPEKALTVPFMTLDLVTPRFDLPRAWTPSGEPVPGEWEERARQDGIGDRIWFTRQRRYITDWEEGGRS